MSNVLVGQDVAKAGLSTIVTFADNSPHESHYFENPEEMITSEGNAPVIYAGNEKIARRHINASLLARFFDPSAVETEAAVFRSLKGTAEFFEGGPNPRRVRRLAGRRDLRRFIVDARANWGPPSGCTMERDVHPTGRSH